MTHYLSFHNNNFSSISIPASSAFTPTGDLAFGEKEVEEAKRKGLVVAVVGSAKDKAQELLVAEGLVIFLGT